MWTLLAMLTVPAQAQQVWQNPATLPPAAWQTLADPPASVVLDDSCVVDAQTGAATCAGQGTLLTVESDLFGGPHAFMVVVSGGASLTVTTAQGGLCGQGAGSCRSLVACDFVDVSSRFTMTVASTGPDPVVIEQYAIAALPAGSLQFDTSEDEDCDGFWADAGTELDCDDDDASFNPGASEPVDAGMDLDCDGVQWCSVDADQDGVAFVGSCDASADRTTSCCDGALIAASSEDREALGWVAPFDCDDDDDTVFEGADQVVGDGIDQACSGMETCFADADADGWGDGPGPTCLPVDEANCCCDGSTAECVGAAVDGDCDDADGTVHPGVDVDTLDPGLVDSVTDHDCNTLAECLVEDDGSATVAEGEACEPPGETGEPCADCDDDGAPTLFLGCTHAPLPAGWWLVPLVLLRRRRGWTTP